MKVSSVLAQIGLSINMYCSVHFCSTLCYHLLLLLQAPCEAEAQCAALVKCGKVFATATEDMDALTFGSTVVLRHLTASEQK